MNLIPEPLLTRAADWLHELADALSDLGNAGALRLELSRAHSRIAELRLELAQAKFHHQPGNVVASEEQSLRWLEQLHQNQVPTEPIDPSEWTTK